MDRLQTKTADCENYEYDKRLTKQLINGLDDKVMIGEIIRELTASEDTDEATSHQVLI